MLLDVLNRLSGHWQVNLETRLARTELYEKRIASSRPSLGFFVLLISSAVIATLGLISNSTAEEIGAMIIAPLMDPILSLSFGFAVSDDKLIRRSFVTVLLGVITVIVTGALICALLDVTHVQSEILGRTTPNLIDLGIAVAAAVAGSFSMTRERLSSSIAGVAIAVALVPPLCVSGIGLNLGDEITAVFGRGTVTGLSNQIAEGSFLLFLANLIGIVVASLMVFLIQQYGSFSRCWRNLLVWFGLLGLLFIHLSSALHDFSLTQEIDAHFSEFKSGEIERLAVTQKNPRFWRRVRVLYSNVRVVNNKAEVDLVLNAPQALVDDQTFDRVMNDLMDRSKSYGLDDTVVNLSVIPNRNLRYSSKRLGG